MNIDKFFRLDYLIGRQECEVYKNSNAFCRKGNEVCYISDFGLRALREEYQSKGIDLTDNEIISKGIGSSYQSIKSEIMEHLAECGKTEHEINIEDEINYVFNEVDWQYTSTFISEFDW